MQIESFIIDSTNQTSDLIVYQPISRPLSVVSGYGSLFFKN